MGTYLYLSLTPEALVASMLPPAEFGMYLAVGSHKRTAGRAIFFQLDESSVDGHFGFEEAKKRCTPHPDGAPKHSVYLCAYRVLERLNLDALRNLWLITRDGMGLELARCSDTPATPQTFHLYQELCPVHPLIASTLDPRSFCRFITDPELAICLPRLCFVDIKLEDLAENPETGLADNLPYHHIGHLRDCLVSLKRSPDKHTKTVDRLHVADFQYRCVNTGFYVGERERALFYPFPSQEDFRTKYHAWWRSANV